MDESLTSDLIDPFMKQVQALHTDGARLITLTGTRDENQEVLLGYFFDRDGDVVSLELRTEGRSAPSLYSWFSGADMVEREVNLRFGVKFVGNPNLPRPGVVA